MEKKRTLYEYLYQCLREQILTGYLGYGDTLPSLNQLCDIYHVGIRTAKDVLKDLKVYGLISTEDR
ncbi:MAG: GntR family transcriptional regulator, partial [Clostridium sp.]|nr:GntR family transcriptional regulator [Clostridium sp.]